MRAFPVRFPPPNPADAQMMNASSMQWEKQSGTARASLGRLWQQGSGTAEARVLESENRVRRGARRLLPRAVSLLAAGICLVAVLPARAAPPRPILDLVPADSLIVYAAKPYASLGAATATGPSEPRGPAGGGGSSIASIVAFLNASGLIPDEGQVFADIAAALPLLGKYEHALVLLDVSSKLVTPTDSPAQTQPEDPASRSLRLNYLLTAAIFRTRGEHRDVLEQVNRVVGRYTNLDVASLSTREWRGYVYQRLSDQRLPGWAVWEWGRVGDFFVVTFGTGAFEKLCRAYDGQTPSLAKDPWYQEAGVSTRADRAIVQWLVSFVEVRKRLGEIAEDRVSAVTKALHAEDISRDLWTIGQEGRALNCYRCYRRGSRNVVRRYSDPANDPPVHRTIIPQEARLTAVIRVPTRWLVDNIPRAWLGAQSAGNADKWRRIWTRLEEEAGMDISGNLVGHLGENVVLFDFPPHPLSIPFAITVAIEISDQGAVQSSTSALLAAWSRYLDERAERNKTTLARLKVRQSEDGIWYMQAGILGPALKVTDRYIVVSWSPEALRQALRRIRTSNAGPVP